MTKDEIISLTSTKALQYKIPIAIGLLAFMFVLRACDSTDDSAGQGDDTPTITQQETDSKVDKYQPRRQAATSQVRENQAKNTPAPKVPETVAAPPPVKKEPPPTWLPISEATMTGRTTLTLDCVEFVPIEGIPHHPERIYENPDCLVKLSKDCIPVSQVVEFIEGEFIPGETRIREKAENEAMIDKVIPDPAYHTSVLPLDAVSIE